MSGQTVQEMPTRKEVRKFVYGLFRGKYSVRGTTEGQKVGWQTPCHDFFHADVDAVDMCIGQPIGEEFGISDMGTNRGVPHHGYYNLGDQTEAFFRKYPDSDLPTPGFTLERFTGMMYDLIRIKHGHSIE